jgi:hypothetical protein
METKDKILKIEKFDYYEFNHVITSKGLRIIMSRIFPYENHFGYFYSIFNTADKIDNIFLILSQLGGDEERILPGNNEWFITLGHINTTFYVTLPDHFPIQLPTDEFRDFLINFKLWLNKVESCQIPGILPESKLDTWSCVPNEYIKDEWWKIQNQKK